LEEYGYEITHDKFDEEFILKAFKQMHNIEALREILKVVH